MRLFRNADIRLEFWIDLGITLAAALIAWLFSPLAALLALIVGAVLTGLHLCFGLRRYRRIEALSKTLDEILHGVETAVIDDSREGELSILQTEIAHMTQRLRDQAGQLGEEKRRLADAIADIFHQIRTPLTSMNLSLAMLSDRELSPERRREIVHGLKKQTERIRWLVESLLRLSKLDAGTARFTVETLPMETLLNRAAEPFRIPMELKGQTLILDAGGATVSCDPAWTAEAIGNLIKNAAEHTPAGGTVRLEACETPLFTELTVTDDGEGFDPQERGKLFERWYKGKNATPESVGIGLCLTRGILAEEGATIAASNNPTGGARFTVRFYKTTV